MVLICARKFSEIEALLGLFVCSSILFILIMSCKNVTMDCAVCSIILWECALNFRHDAKK